MRRRAIGFLLCGLALLPIRALSVSGQTAGEKPATVAAAAPNPESPPHPDVKWACRGTDADDPILRSRFEPGSVTVSWRGATHRLQYVAGGVGARYLGWGDSAGTTFWVRPDDRAFLRVGEEVVGCRAERRHPQTTMPRAEGESALDLATALVLGLPRQLTEFSSVVPVERDRSDFGDALGPIWVLDEEWERLLDQDEDLDELLEQRESEEEAEKSVVSRLRVDFDLDIFHQRPRDVVDPQLSDWQVSFRGSDEGLLDLLRSQYGEGKELTHRRGRPLRFGPFYWTRRSAGFDLEYQKREPEWAVPPRDAATERREIARVQRLLEGGIRRADLEKEFGPLGTDPWGSSLEGLTEHWRVTVRPASGPIERCSLIPRGRPIPAGPLIRTLGLREPVVLSHDQHSTGRDLEDARTGPPMVRGYRVEISIDTTGVERSRGESGEALRRGTATWRPETFPIRAITLRRAGAR